MAAENTTSAFGASLSGHRRRIGLSQEELAERAGLSVDGIAALERGRRTAPRPLTVRMLADALDLDDAARTAFVAASRPDVAAAVQVPPLPTGELIGRAAELERAAAALRSGSTRLLTLAGPGGVGKTSLAITLAATLREVFPEQCWVPVDAVPAGGEVTAAAGAALGVLRAPGLEEREAVAAHVGRRRLLLVIDSCEHVVDRCARLVEWLLQRCEQLAVLATSREPLHLPAEMVHRVPPLALPVAGADAERTLDAPAVRLFLARAAYPVPGGRLAEVGALCRRLDGLPLAIELAAARTSVLTVRQIGAELDRSAAILARAGATGPRRQLGLESAIAWSHDLLTPEEQRFLASVSVFRGGWTLASAEAVTGHRERARVLDLTSRLVDKSLVVVRHEGDEARYDMLAVVREFAARRLEDSGERAAAEQRFVAHLAQLADRAEAELRREGQARWLGLLDSELDNVRAAMAVATERAWSGAALRISGGLARYFYLRGRYTEGRRWLDAALDLDGDHADLPDRVRTRALAASGYLAFLQCEYPAAEQRLGLALAQCHASGDRSGAALVLRSLGSVARERADYERAETLHREGLALSRADDDASGVAWAEHHLGFVAWLRGDLSAAARHARAAQQTFSRVGDEEGVVWTLIGLGVIARHRGDLPGADRLLLEARDRSRGLAFREGVAWSLNQLGVLATVLGQLERAVHELEQSLSEHHELGDRWRTASVLEALATVLHHRGRDRGAAFLLGAAEELRSAIGAPVPLCERPDRDRTVAAVTARLGPGGLAAAWAAGGRAPLHSVVAGDLPPED
nr:helix-turn-helix domain-containing protein [Georgenia satyanarayanai]